MTRSDRHRDFDATLERSYVLVASRVANGTGPVGAELDEAVADRPVFIMLGFNGPSTTNSQGREFFLSRGVVVGQDGAIGSGTQSLAALFHLRQGQTFADAKRSTLDAMAYATAFGLTTHLDQGAFPAAGTS